MEHKALAAYIGALFALHQGKTNTGEGFDYIIGQLDAIGELFGFAWGREELEGQPEKRPAWIYTVYRRENDEAITTRSYPWNPAPMPTE